VGGRKRRQAGILYEVYNFEEMTSLYFYFVEIKM
jgi:hypothetical protein